MTREFDLVVIGGGMLGAFVALLAADKRLRVLGLRMTDMRSPEAETLRNQAILVSGLLYFDKSKTQARGWYQAGRDMHRYLNLELPDDHIGLLQLADDAAAQRLEFQARSLQVPLQQIMGAEADRLLRAFRKTGRPVYQIPDRVFDEANVLTVARQEAKDAGVCFVDLTRPCRLVRNGSNYLVECEIGTFDPGRTIVVAGPRTTTLLNALGVPHPLVVARSSLAVVNGSQELAVNLLIDKGDPLKMSLITRHLASTVPPNGCLVVGGNTLTSSDPSDPNWRYASQVEEEALLRLLPPKLARKAKAHGGYRITGGHMVGVRDSTGKPSVDPWIGEFEELPRMSFGVCGRATLAHATAAQLLVEALRDRSVTTTVDITNARDWADDVEMHHNDKYSHLNEVYEAPARGGGRR